MKIEFSKLEDNIHLVTVSGDIDYRASSEIRSQIAEWLKSNPSNVMICLAEVHYIDSSGIAALVELQQTLRRAGGKLVLYALSESVRGVFELAKMHLFFTIAGTEEAALNTLKA